MCWHGIVGRDLSLAVLSPTLALGIIMHEYIKVVHIIYFNHPVFGLDFLTLQLKVGRLSCLNGHRIRDSRITSALSRIQPT